VRPVLRLLTLLLGIAIVAWLLARADLAAVFAVIGHVGWGFIAILLARAATVVVDCAAWQALIPPGERLRFLAMLPLRWIGESINTTLPAGQVGGDVIRARLLQQRVPEPAPESVTDVLPGERGTVREQEVPPDRGRRGHHQQVRGGDFAHVDDGDEQVREGG